MIERVHEHIINELQLMQSAPAGSRFHEDYGHNRAPDHSSVVF